MCSQAASFADFGDNKNGIRVSRPKAHDDALTLALVAVKHKENRMQTYVSRPKVWTEIRKPNYDDEGHYPKAK